MLRVFPEEDEDEGEGEDEYEDRDEQMVVNLAAKLNQDLKIFTRKEILSPKSRPLAELSSIMKELVRQWLDQADGNRYTEEWQSLMRDRDPWLCFENDHERDWLRNLVEALHR